MDKATLKKPKRALSVGYLFLSLLLITAAITYWGASLSPVAPRLEGGSAPALKPTVDTRKGKKINVRDFGAKGDGRTNDLRAIQAAVNKAGSAGGGIVYFPKGIYLVDGSIVVNKNKVELEGAGWESEIRITQHPERVIVIEGSSNNAVRNLQVSLGVPGGTRNDHDEGIYVTSKASNFIIENVLGNKKGIMVRGQVNKGIIRNNTIRNSLADGIHITGGSSNISIENNDLIETGDDSIAVVSYRSQQALSSNITIKGNRIQRSYSRGIAHVGGKNVLISNNRIEGTSSSGILVVEDHNYDTYAPEDTQIEGNTVLQAGGFAVKRGNQFGIEITSGASSVTIVNNTISESVSRGMSVSAAGTLIKDNLISRNRDSGLQVDGSDCTITGNRFENNGTFGFFSANSDRLTISGNKMSNNNESNGMNIDNFVLKDSRNSTVTDNESLETREPMQVAHSYYLIGSCSDLVFERNETSGTLLGSELSCIR